VATSEVVGSFFLSSDELLRVKELAVGSRAHLIDHSRFEINHHATRNMLPCPSFRKKCVKCIITTADGLVTGHLTIRLNAMLEAEEFPARIANLNTTLTKMKAEDLTHNCKRKAKVKSWKRKVRQGA
jgi:hypothetical protein